MWKSDNCFLESPCVSLSVWWEHFLDKAKSNDLISHSTHPVLWNLPSAFTWWCMSLVCSIPPFIILTIISLKCKVIYSLKSSPQKDWMQMPGAEYFTFFIVSHNTPSIIKCLRSFTLIIFWSKANPRVIHFWLQYSNGCSMPSLAKIIHLNDK